jgi:hypothetical protein
MGCGTQVPLLQELDKGHCRALDEHERRRFERLYEALRQPIGKAVLVPGLRDAPDPHLEVPGGRIGVEQAQVLPQLVLGLAGRAEPAAVMFRHVVMGEHRRTRVCL